MSVCRIGLGLSLIFVLGYSTLAQENALKKKITIHLEDVPLPDALDQIAELSGISFSYSSRSIPVDRKITLHATNQSLEHVLEDLLLGTQVTYVWVEGKVVLKKAASDPNDPPTTYTISGYLKDKESGETLIGATILVKELGTGTLSNAYGFYSLTLPAGHYHLRYSYVGYQILETEVRLSENLRIDQVLEPNASLLQEIIVTVNDSVKTIDESHANVTQLTQSTILQKPSVLGEPDVIKSLDILPGIHLFNDGSAFFNVRGGNRDQNQILVDEAPIYNPAHLLGLFSSFMPSDIKDIKIYKGNAGADFGGRIASVMDIHTREGNLKKHSLNGRIGLVTSSLSVDGPIKKDKSAFFLSGRRSHIRAYLNSQDFDAFQFYDLTGKVNFTLNPNNRLFLSVFSSTDEYIQSEGLAWKNIAGTIRWNHTFSDRLFANTTFYSSKYEYQLITSPTRTWKNHIANISLKTDFSFYQSPNSTAKFGFKISGHNFNPGNLEGDPNAPFVPKRNATELSLYYSKEKVISNNWLLTYGLRLSTWSNYGRTIEYTIDENYEVVDTTTYTDRRKYNDYTNLEPRLKLTHIISEHSMLSINYSRSAQYINLISNSISPFNNLEVWLPASVNIKPQTANQISASWIYAKPQWRWQIEGYYKAMQNQIDYANQAELLLNPHFEAEIRSGTGSAYGMEASLEKRSGKLTGNVSLVLSRSFRKIEGINEGKQYRALSDRPIQFSVFAAIQKNERTNFSGTLIISSGSPVTTPTSFYQYAGRIVPIYAEKNNDRLPTYHRLDLGWSHRLNKAKRRFNHYLTASLFNFYGQKNSILRSFNKILLEDEKYVVPSEINNAEQLKATHIYVYQLVPSISYSFHL